MRPACLYSGRAREAERRWSARHIPRDRVPRQAGSPEGISSQGSPGAPTEGAGPSVSGEPRHSAHPVTPTAAPRSGRPWGLPFLLLSSPSPRPRISCPGRAGALGAVRSPSHDCAIRATERHSADPDQNLCRRRGRFRGNLAAAPGRSPAGEPHAAMRIAVSRCRERLFSFYGR